MKITKIGSKFCIRHTAIIRIFYLCWDIDVKSREINLSNIRFSNNFKL